MFVGEEASKDKVIQSWWSVCLAVAAGHVSRDSLLPMQVEEGEQNPVRAGG
jgi:hypothetical protein